MKSLIKMITGMAMLIAVLLVKIYADMQKQVGKQKVTVAPSIIPMQENEPLVKLVSLQLNMLY